MNLDGCGYVILKHAELGCSLRMCPCTVCGVYYSIIMLHGYACYYTCHVCFFFMDNVFNL
jgi:hypothetical protein